MDTNQTDKTRSSKGMLALLKKKDWLRRIKWLRVVRMQVRYHMKQYPRVYIPLARLRYNDYESNFGTDIIYTSPIRNDTEVVIEGPHRCGNTFAVVAFHLAQDRPVKVAHHLHAAAQVICAIRQGIPRVVLLRDPEQATISHVATFPCPMKMALKEYVIFYSELLPYINDIIIADFDTITSDFGIIIDAVNRRFGTSFHGFVPNEKNVEQCFELINKYYYRKDGDELETEVARPSGMRQMRKEELKEAYYTGELSELRERADRLYHEFYSKSEGNLNRLEAATANGTASDTSELVDGGALVVPSSAFNRQGGRDVR